MAYDSIQLRRAKKTKAGEYPTWTTVHDVSGASPDDPRLTITTSLQILTPGLADAALRKVIDFWAAAPTPRNRIGCGDIREYLRLTKGRSRPFKPTSDEKIALSHLTSVLDCTGRSPDYAFHPGWLPSQFAAAEDTGHLLFVRVLSQKIESGGSAASILPSSQQAYTEHILRSATGLEQRMRELAEKAAQAREPD